MRGFPDDVNYVNQWFKWKIIFLYYRIIAFLLSLIGLGIVVIAVMNDPQDADQIFTYTLEGGDWVIFLSIFYVICAFIYIRYLQQPGPTNRVPRDDRRGRNEYDDRQPGF